MVFDFGLQFAPLGLAVFRIIVGGIFVSHAIPKIESPKSTRDFFESLGIPASMYMVYLALGIEVIAGTLLAIGLYTQLSALVLTLFMSVVTYIAIVKMDKEFEGGYEVDLLLLCACFLYFTVGAGPYAVEAAL